MTVIAAVEINDWLGLISFADELDFERYDTTVGIPTNLEDGLYVLQLAMLVGNGGAPYFSCAKLHITGGNTAFSCQSNDLPVLYSCFRSNSGRKLDDSDLYEGTIKFLCLITRRFPVLTKK